MYNNYFSHGRTYSVVERLDFRIVIFPPIGRVMCKDARTPWTHARWFINFYPFYRKTVMSGPVVQTRIENHTLAYKHRINFITGEDRIDVHVLHYNNKH